jgi:hypothetical protein
MMWKSFGCCCVRRTLVTALLLLFLRGVLENLSGWVACLGACLR